MTLKEFLDRHSDALLDFQTVSLWEREELLLRDHWFKDRMLSALNDYGDREVLEESFSYLRGLVRITLEKEGEQPTVPVFGQWTPASNPPADRESVIVYVPDHGVEACYCCYEDGKWYVHGVKFDYVTAWMPLPEPPEEGGARR